MKKEFSSPKMSLDEKNKMIEDMDTKITKQEVIEDEDLVVTENRLSKVIHEYRRSYKRGVMKFGIWWKILQLSIWGMVLIFLVTATIIFVFFPHVGRTLDPTTTIGTEISISPNFEANLDLKPPSTRFIISPSASFASESVTSSESSI